MNNKKDITLNEEDITEVDNSVKPEEEVKEEVINTNKKSKKKLVILIILGTLIIAISIVLIIIFCKKEDKDSIKELSYVEYNKYVKEYGNEIYDLVEKYYEENKKIPSFNDIKDDIKNKKVSCEDINIFPIEDQKSEEKNGGSVLLKHCKIDGYKYNPDVVFYKQNSLGANIKPTPEKKFVDLSTVTPDKLGARTYSASLLEKLGNTSTKVEKYDIYYTLDNGTLNLYTESQNKPSITYSSVTDVYHTYMDCRGDSVFVIYTKDKIVNINVKFDGDKLEEEYKYTIDNDGTYEGAYSIFIESSTCGADEIYTIKNSYNEYITFKDKTKFNINETNLSTIDFAKNFDSDYKSNVDNLPSAKAIFVDYGSGSFQILIDKDNYVYGIKDNKLTKLSNIKAKEIKENDKKNYEIYLENDTVLDVELRGFKEKEIFGYLEIANEE